MNRRFSGKIKRLGRVICIFQTFSDVTDYGLVSTDVTQNQVTNNKSSFRGLFLAAAMPK
jgi:aminopeptidase C